MRTSLTHRQSNVVVGCTGRRRHRGGLGRRARCISDLHLVTEEPRINGLAVGNSNDCVDRVPRAGSDSGWPVEMARRNHANVDDRLKPCSGGQEPQHVGNEAVNSHTRSDRNRFHDGVVARGYGEAGASQVPEARVHVERRGAVETERVVTGRESGRREGPVRAGCQRCLKDPLAGGGFHVEVIVHHEFLRPAVGCGDVREGHSHLRNQLSGDASGSRLRAGRAE